MVQDLRPLTLRATSRLEAISGRLAGPSEEEKHNKDNHKMIEDEEEEGKEGEGEGEGEEEEEEEDEEEQ